MVQMTIFGGIIMERNQVDQTLQIIHDWTATVDGNWQEAKSRLKDYVNVTELNQWENGLDDLYKSLELIKNNRGVNDSEEFATDLEQIKQQCNKLYDKYTAFSKTMANTDVDQQEELNNRLKFGKSEPSWTPPKNSIPPGKHKLPPLPYKYNALEPYISKEIMKLHHDIHHKAYVEGLNKAELKMLEARQTGSYDLIRHWEREAAFNGAGHYLHTIFWDVMSPDGGGKPKGDLLKQIEHDFGSYKAFKTHFTEAAKKVEGPGWAILVWSPRSHRLEILQAEKHQNLSQWDVVPLLVLDVWEHAYYLQYKTDKDKYVDQWWNIVNWDYVAKRFNKAEKLQWKPY